MFYRLRRAQGGSSEFSKGALIGRDGAARLLRAGDVQLGVLRRWKSATSGVEYPVEWRLRVMSAGLDLHLAPLIDEQELDLAVRYWEGAVRSIGSGDESVTAEGYLELAGYGEGALLPRR
jgi:predicted secreted hydrolase